MYYFKEDTKNIVTEFFMPNDPETFEKEHKDFRKTENIPEAPKVDKGYKTVLFWKNDKLVYEIEKLPEEEK